MLFILLLLGLVIAGFVAFRWLVDMALIREIVRDEMSGHEPQGEALAFIEKRLKEKKGLNQKPQAIPSQKGFFRLPVFRFPGSRS